MRAFFFAFAVLPTAVLANAPFELTDSEWMFNLLDTDANGVVNEIDTREVLDSAHPRVRGALEAHAASARRYLDVEEDEYSSYDSYDSYAEEEEEEGTVDEEEEEDKNEIKVSASLTFKIAVDNCTLGGTTLEAVAAAQRRAISKTTSPSIALEYIVTDDIRCVEEGRRLRSLAVRQVAHAYTVLIPEEAIEQELTDFDTAQEVKETLDALVEEDKDVFVEELLSEENLGAVEGVTIDEGTGQEIKSSITQEANIESDTKNPASSSGSSFPNWAIALVVIGVVGLVVGLVAFGLNSTSDAQDSLSSKAYSNGHGTTVKSGGQSSTFDTAYAPHEL